MGLGQIVVLIMVNKCMKYDEICFSTFKVIGKVKVCHDDDDNNDQGNNYVATDAARVMTIPRLFFKTAELTRERCSPILYISYIFLRRRY